MDISSITACAQCSIGFLNSSKALLILHLSLIFEAFRDIRYSKRESVMQLRTGVKYRGSYLERFP
jgi:hypothetical protein